MKTNQKLSLATTLAALGLLASSQAQTIVYDNLATAATAGYSEPNTNHPIFGDALNLTMGGKISIFGLSVYNSTSGGNTGSILAGTMTIDIYDNTAPYAGGPLSAEPLLGTATGTINFGTGLAPGFYSTVSFDLSSLNINVPQSIFVTQQFTETSGTSTRNGVILFSNPAIGSSPPYVYINSSATPEGLYAFANNPNQFGYHVEIATIPEPSSFALAGLSGLGAAAMLRRRK
jgi:MYXO-CTERM domain-containing protein